MTGPEGKSSSSISKLHTATSEIRPAASSPRSPSIELNSTYLKPDTPQYSAQRPRLSISYFIIDNSQAACYDRCAGGKSRQEEAGENPALSRNCNSAPARMSQELLLLDILEEREPVSSSAFKGPHFPERPTRPERVFCFSGRTAPKAHSHDPSVDYPMQKRPETQTMAGELDTWPMGPMPPLRSLSVRNTPTRRSICLNQDR